MVAFGNMRVIGGLIKLCCNHSFNSFQQRKIMIFSWGNLTWVRSSQPQNFCFHKNTIKSPKTHHKVSMKTVTSLK